MSGALLQKSGAGNCKNAPLDDGAGGSGTDGGRPAASSVRVLAALSRTTTAGEPPMTDEQQADDGGRAAGVRRGRDTRPPT
jgi:hypothetical protein